MDKVHVTGIKVHAYHGCLPEEAIAGGPFEVDISVWCDLKKAAQTDELEDTIDYVRLTELVHREMAQRSKLIEHVGQRIINAVKSELNGVQKVWIHIKKLQPPLKAELYAVSVEMEG